jgi:hypothetical protein
MMTNSPKFWVFPYTQGSKGAKMLAEALGCKRILREGSSYSYKQGDIVINWGASDCPYKEALNLDNSAVLNKYKFFQRLAGTGLVPPFANSVAGAKSLKFPVFCRTKLKGRDGAGIVIADSPDQLVGCDLYVEGVDKTSEYRIHVGRLPNGEVRIIGAQKKVKKFNSEGMDPRVWCGDGTTLVWTVNGQPAFIPPKVMACALAAFEKFPELTFGAFDAIYDNSASLAYVIEINSAPMGTPETSKRYADFFKEFAAQKMMEQAGVGTELVSVQATPTVAPEPVAKSSPAIIPPLTQDEIIILKQLIARL